jgi:hypothetical protein
MGRTRLAAALTVIGANLLMAPNVGAQPARVALVIGNATYATLQGIPACSRSANAVAAALRALGFDVTERQDASVGGIDAGIGEFSQHLTDSKGAAVVYVCGYGATFNDRTFLLPVTARIPRPSDVLTQGVLVKSLLDSVTRGAEGSAVVAFDMVPKPDGPPQIGLSALAETTMPDGVGLIAVTQATPGDAPTPLATALTGALEGPMVRAETLLADVRRQLTGGNAIVAALHMPVRAGYLAGAPPSPPPQVVMPPPPVVAVEPPPTPRPATVPAATPAVMVAMPDEAEMIDADRRKAQIALARIGYYALPVDGIFGPETRAAIRRYQHEIGVQITGRLTASEASRLVSTQ